ncbi:hypothetical protein [Actinopolyspora erythraea]|uniref:hypothetical protein n=1 Tax=Actinopolyspora erythraea TaxID=414996 RepID=UPI000A93AFF8|nr:hypothetical protein [Actinopolyspora erythraea]
MLVVLMSVGGGTVAYAQDASDVRLDDIFGLLRTVTEVIADIVQAMGGLIP